MSSLELIPRSAIRQVDDKLRRGSVAEGVAAAYYSDVTPNDLDGWRGRFLVSDGARREVVDAGISGSKGGYRGMPVNPAAVERALERYAGGFDRDSRLRDLVDASPVLLTSL
jgi:hypothetical protein